MSGAATSPANPELPTITALSLAVLRRRVEELLIGEDLEIRLVLDHAARLERDCRRQQPQLARRLSW